MVTVEQAIIARLKKQNNVFEVLVDCSLAVALKQGKDISLADVLAVRKIFSDSKKGMEASPTAMKQSFGTDSFEAVAKEIIKSGEIHLTADYKNSMREAKKKQLINIIHRNAVDPKTHLPHPAARIESAMEQAKVRIDEFRPVEEQVQAILSKLRPIIPIKFELKEIAVKLPSQYTGKAYSTLKSFGKMLKEEWQNDGSFVAVLEIPGGMEQEFYDALNSATHGDNETKLLSTK